MSLAFLLVPGFFLGLLLSMAAFEDRYLVVGPGRRDDSAARSRPDAIAEAPAEHPLAEGH